LYESELLVELMLRYWHHPLADDQVFRNDLLEAAVGSLKTADEGVRLFDDIPPDKTNLVAAICYSEMVAIQADPSGSDREIRALRVNWLETVRRTLPSCFCDPDLLP